MSSLWAFLRALLAGFGLWRVHEAGEDKARSDATQEVLDDASAIDAAQRDPEYRDSVQQHTGWD